MQRLEGPLQEARTLHSLLGLVIMKPTDTVDSLVARIQKNPAAVRVWQDLKTLFVDEAAAGLSALDFDLLEGAARILRETPAVPFGGIVLVLLVSNSVGPCCWFACAANVIDPRS